MNPKISVVINTFNEASTLPRLLASVQWADEILVCDMNSEDDSALIAKKMGAKVIFHKRMEFVELARDFAISKASGDWIFILDPDEEVPEKLAIKLQEISKNQGIATFVEIPRKNIIFGKWVKASMWWPDLNIRFFKQNTITWSKQIHRPPQTQGQGLVLPAEERFAITHYHYDNISQFLKRLDRYTSAQAKELKKSGYKFVWQDLITKPLSEFLSRFFANKGYDDGLHGFALSLLQAFSFLIVYLKTWEEENFQQKDLNINDVKEVSNQAGKEINYWFKYGNLSNNPLKSFLQRAKNKIT